MYSWHRAGDVAAKCLLSMLGGILLGIYLWFLLNIAYLCLGMPVDGWFEYAMKLQGEWLV